MKRPIQILRLIDINFIIFRNRLDSLVYSTKTFQSFSFLSYLNPWHWYGNKNLPRGESIRIALEQLGPVFVKFGQILSTRRDLLPDDIADELAKLQDQVPPFEGEVAKNIVETAYKKPINKIFLTFDLIPFASASIAQVHSATLNNGQQVVVKILRPNIEKIIRRDISLLYSAATMTEKFLPQGKKLRPKEVIAELEKSLHYELDLLHEGANASQLRRNFNNSPLLYVPKVFWEYSTNEILVMERIEGIPVSDIATLKQHKIDLKKLAERGVEIFFTQVLRDSFFHADMHPGNIFVNKMQVIEPQYIAVDFGIMGTLSPVDQHYLAENLLAFFRRDYRRVAELHIESGWVAGNIRVDEFETAIRGVSEPIFEQPLQNISFGKLLLKLFQAAREFNMQVQPQFFLLQKTLLNIEGLGRQLYPQLDLWTTAKPYLEQWVRKQLGPRTMINKIYHQAPYMLDKMLQLPDLLHANLVAQIRANKEENSYHQELQTKLKTNNKKGIALGILIMVIVNLIFILLSVEHILLINLIIGLLGVLIIAS